MTVHRTYCALGQHGRRHTVGGGAHFHHPRAGIGFSDTGLHPLEHLVIFQADEARRTDEISLSQSMSDHLLGIVVVAEQRPLDDELVRSMRHDVPHAERVQLLLYDQRRPDGLERGRPRRIHFLDVFDDAAVVELHGTLELPQFRFLLAIEIELLRFRRCHRSVSADRVTGHFRTVAGDHEAERHQIRVQQGGVVGILEILDVHFPVRRHRMGVVADHPQLAAVERGVEILEDLGPDIVLEQLDILRE